MTWATLCLALSALARAGDWLPRGRGHALFPTVSDLRCVVMAQEGFVDRGHVLVITAGRDSSSLDFSLRTGFSV